MIENLTLKSFKSFQFRDLPIENLTVLTGLNSSGKSSVIQALLILEKAFNNERSLFLDGHGTQKELKNKNSKEEISFDVLINGEEYTVSFPDNDIEYGKNIYPNLWYISANRFGPQLSIPISNDLRFKSKIGKNGENVLQCIKYFTDENPIALNELIKHPDSASLDLLANIRAWLKVISPNVEFNYDVISISDTSYATFDGNRATNVGFGLSYILPVITSLLASTLEGENNLVIIENPEAHLHPKGQTELAQLICLCASLGVQVVVETHSDHIFTGMRLFAKKNKGFAEKAIFYWFELDERRNTEVTSIYMDDNGRVKDWPKGFFDQFEVNYSKLI